MTQRLDLSNVAPAAYKALLGVHTYVQQSGLDHGLLELLRLRVSQINGCAFCISMHVPLARQGGIEDAKLHLLPVWREADLFSPAERAVLAFAEAVTRLKDGEVDDAVYDELARHFRQKEVADLCFAVAEINAWNRLAITTRTPPLPMTVEA